ncbi:MAG TPA: histidine--tRNA ligase [Candidatus Paceibacterota bacterium]
MRTRITKDQLKSPAGFGDWSPEQASALDHMLGIIREQYMLAGFTPMHTPLVERPEILFAKAQGEVTNQVYGLRLMKPAENSPTDEKNLAIRFDHTVPLARFVAANQGEMVFPFRRCAIGPVVRGEHPKDGRYREFIQADVDVIGDKTLSFDHDAEMISIISSVFDKLAFGPFTIRINNRKLLTGYLGSIGCETPDVVRRAVNIVDDLEKKGRTETLQNLADLGIEENNAQHALEFLTRSYTIEEAFEELRSLEYGKEFATGVAELETVIDSVRQFGIPASRYCIDLSIARGLNYYTSTVYEAQLDDYPDLGSIAGGGRYDNLADDFSPRHLPGVGVSIGVTRLLRRLIKMGIVEIKSKTVAKVLVASRDFQTEKELHLSRASLLRSAGIPTEAFLEKRDLGKQLNFAARRGMKVVVFTHHGNDDHDAGRKIVVRNLEQGDQIIVPEADLVVTVQSML